MDIEDLENLVWLIENEGELSIGRVGPYPCAAVAADEHNQLAAVVKMPGESIGSLLQRLDKAVQKAWDEEVFTDEINN